MTQWCAKHSQYAHTCIECAAPHVESAERVYELMLNIAKLYAAVGPMDEFDDTDTVVQRIKDLRAKLEEQERVHTQEFTDLRNERIELRRELASLREKQRSEP